MFPTIFFLSAYLLYHNLTNFISKVGEIKELVTEMILLYYELHELHEFLRISRIEYTEFHRGGTEFHGVFCLYFHAFYIFHRATL